MAAAVLVGLVSVSAALAGGGAGGADVQVSGSASTGAPTAGATFTYTFQVKNSGSVSASDVVFTDELPDGTGFNYAVKTIGGANYLCEGQGMLVTCNLGTMPKGTQYSVTISLNAPVTVGTFANTGAAASGTADVQPANNASTVTAQVKTPLAACPVPAGETTAMAMVMLGYSISSPNGPLLQDLIVDINGVQYYVFTNFWDGTAPLTTVINLDCKQSPVQFIGVGNFVNITGVPAGTVVVGGTELPAIDASVVQVFTHKDAI
jgi:uncharacterized repeat protein (TIGR01451 family)